MNWTIDEICYMEEHAGEGAAAIAEHLNRTVISVKVQASRQGIFLTPRWRCPNCGCLTAKPLNAKTGWCANCTMEARREQIAKDVRELEDEVARRERNEKARQALYSKKSRLRKKLRGNSPNQ